MVGRAPSATNSIVQFKLFDLKLAQNFLSVLTFPSYSAFPGVLWSPPELQAFTISCLDDVSKVLLKNTQRNQIKFQGESVREPQAPLLFLDPGLSAQPTVLYAHPWPVLLSDFYLICIENPHWFCILLGMNYYTHLVLLPWIEFHWILHFPGTALKFNLCHIKNLVVLQIQRPGPVTPATPEAQEGGVQVYRLVSERAQGHCRQLSETQPPSR